MGESRTFLLLGLGLAAIAAVFGIITPAMTMTAQQVTPVGEISLYHESRGIWDTVRGLLGRDGSLIVGIPLLVFSIVLPLAKTALLATALASRGKVQPRVMDVISRLGRWSMADVFVVALLLSFFAANHNRLISASLLPGMAFFAYYAVLSILLGGRIEKRLGRRSRSRGLGDRTGVPPHLTNVAARVYTSPAALNR